MRRVCIQVMGVMLMGLAAHGEINWSADFETPPYAQGSVNGQQGWWASTAIPAVTNEATAPSGTQVLRIAGQNQAGNALGYPNATQNGVKVTVYMKGPSYAAGHAAMHFRYGSTYFIWCEFQEAGDGGWGYYNIYGDTGNQWAGAAGARLIWNQANWEKIEVWLDLENDQFKVAINDVVIEEWYNNSGALVGTHQWTPFDNLVPAFNALQISIGTMKNDPGATPYMLDGLVVEENVPLVPPSGTCFVVR